MGRHKEPARSANDTLAKNILTILNSGDGYDENIKKLNDLGISKHTIRSWLMGHRAPKVATLRNAARVLNVNYLDFFSREDNTNATNN